MVECLLLVQVIVIPCGLTASLSTQDKVNLFDECVDFIETLKKSGIRCRGDFRDNYTAGWKFNDWELKVRNDDIIVVSIP